MKQTPQTRKMKISNGLNQGQREEQTRAKGFMQGTLARKEQMKAAFQKVTMRNMCNKELGSSKFK